MAFTDVFVPIHPGAERCLAVVQVECENFFKAYRPVQLPHRCPIFFFGLHRVAGRKHMAGVKTDADDVGVFDFFEDCAELFELPAEVRALPGGRLEQNLCGELFRLPVDFIDPAGNLLDSGRFAAAGVGPGVRNHVGNLQSRGAIEFHYQGIDRFFPEYRLRAGQIDQIRIVRDRVGNA